MRVLSALIRSEDPQGLDVFRTPPRQTLHFCGIYRRESNPQFSVPTTDALPLSYNATYYDVLPQLLNDILCHSIQHTTYFSSRKTTRWYFAINGLSKQPLNHSYCALAFGCDSSDNPHYPFSYQFANWCCSEVSTTCYSPPARLAIRRWNVNERSFHYTCFTVTTTGFFSDRTLAGVSRLA